MQPNTINKNRTTVWPYHVWSLLAILLLFAFLAFLAWGNKQVAVSYHVGKSLSINLSPSALPYYAFRTVTRLFIALCFTLLFTFTIGSLAAKNKHAQRVIIPIIDVLQSVPILGFLSITMIWFIALFPHGLLGPECAAIFAIFTCQAWNVFLGFYQSLRTIPSTLRDISDSFQLSNWQKFWRLDVPFALPSLIWNIMIALSNSWFFVVASEAITVNKEKILLPGVGSYIRTAIDQQNGKAIVYAIITMIMVILLYDQIIFRPLIAWSSKFKTEQTSPQRKSFLLKWFSQKKWIQSLDNFLDIIFDTFVNISWLRRKSTTQKFFTWTQHRFLSTLFVYLWYTAVISIALLGLGFLIRYIVQTISLIEIRQMLILGFYTTLRIVSLISLCSIIWVPIGVWIGFRPHITKVIQPLVQLLAAFPMNLLFPVVTVFILTYHLNFQIWCAPLLILGPQWYLLFNIIAGTSSIPQNLKQTATSFGVSGWLWWKRFVLPVVFPFFITGAMATAGGAWNATIVGEMVNWGNTTLTASGLGSYVTLATQQGDFPKIALGITVMCLYVLFFDHIFWQRLYNIAARRTHKSKDK